MPTLSIIGAGRVGRVLGHLAHHHGCVQIASVYCRTLAHASEAVAFIGAGTATDRLEALAPADWYLLAVPDDALHDVAERLAAVGIQPGALVFHVSGACEASILLPLHAQQARLASLHPAFSFAEPARSVEQFAGTYCALEGDDLACDELSRLAQAIGGRPFTLAPGGKAAYHAALSVASNYLVTLTDLAQQLAGQAGIGREEMHALLSALMHRTLDNVLDLGAQAALTGPIARGDRHTVERHLQVLADSATRATYLALGRATLSLAAERLSPQQLTEMEALLRD